MADLREKIMARQLSSSSQVEQMDVLGQGQEKGRRTYMLLLIVNITSWSRGVGSVLLFKTLWIMTEVGKDTQRRKVPSRGFSYKASLSKFR